MRVLTGPRKEYRHAQGKDILLPSDLKPPPAMMKSWQEVVIVSEELPEEVQRWTAKRRSALIVSIIRGETSVQEAARKYGLTVAEVEDWREKFLSGAENALRSRPIDEEAQKDEQIKKLKQKVGELVLDMDILKEA